MDIFEAAEAGDASEALALLEADPELAEEYSDDGWTALHLACFYGHLDLAQGLVAHGADVSQRSQNDMRQTALDVAIAGRHEELVRLLLESGANPNSTIKGGWTPLQSAAANGDENVVRMLLQHGADRAALLKDGRSAAVLAREHGHLEIATLLESE